jgi:glutathione S-transferase
MPDRPIDFHHAPNSRSGAVLFLFEELAAPRRLHVVRLDRGEQKSPGFLAINPMGKVPTIVDDGTVVTELGAIVLHLGDRFADRGLTPQPGEAERGTLLRWLFFYGNCFEPALCDRVLERAPGKPSLMPYGSFDDMWSTLVDRLAQGPWILGDRFTVADTLWGSALSWATAAGLLPPTPEVTAYAARIGERAALRRARQIDADLLAEG